MSTDPDSNSVFGAAHLGYLVIETQRFSDWRRFGADAIGLHHDGLDADHHRFRLDDRQCRFLLQRGPAEDVTAVGWHLDDHHAFELVEARLRRHGIPTTQGSDDEAALRGVERLVRFPGPKGLVQEIFTTPLTTDAPLALRATSGFVTGEGGLGHIALTSKHPTGIHQYFATVLDARLTDHIDETINGARLKIRFLRVNQRHHSVAVAETRPVALDPVRTRLQHLNTQVASLDDLAASYQRVHELGFDMALSVGQHTNDKELSYYAVTPSGFEWEVGWNPIVVDEATWQPATHQGISIWGHTPVGQAIVEKLGLFARAALSAARREETVPALSQRWLAT